MIMKHTNKKSYQAIKIIWAVFLLFRRVSDPTYYRPQTKFAKIMFSQVSVCPRGGVCPIACWDTHTGQTLHPQAGHPPAQCMLGYGQQEGGTHPTGMHSCTCLTNTFLGSCSSFQFNVCNSNFTLCCLVLKCVLKCVTIKLTRTYTLGHLAPKCHVVLEAIKTKEINTIQCSQKN